MNKVIPNFKVCFFQEIKSKACEGVPAIFALIVKEKMRLNSVLWLISNLHAFSL